MVHSVIGFVRRCLRIACGLGAAVAYRACRDGVVEARQRVNRRLCWVFHRPYVFPLSSYRQCFGTACAVSACLACGNSHASSLDGPLAARSYRATLVREAQFIYGIGAPVPVFAAQIEQESSWNPNAKSFDGGMGLWQGTGKTPAWVAAQYPDLGPVDNFNPTWAIRALVRLDAYNYLAVQGDTVCDQWGATLKAYNAGLGYVQKAQMLSLHPNTWFGVTENINAGQSAQNFAFSRLYPRRILFDRQPKYATWGDLTNCGKP